jgi:hypothetical protein
MLSPGFKLVMTIGLLTGLPVLAHAQTCYYVPQTSYRTIYELVPVTIYQPVLRYDFLTGWPVTTYRPVTVWTRQARMAPYTTYRIVYGGYTLSPATVPPPAFSAPPLGGSGAQTSGPPGCPTCPPAGATSLLSPIPGSIPHGATRPVAPSLPASPSAQAAPGPTNDKATPPSANQSPPNTPNGTTPNGAGPRLESPNQQTSPAHPDAKSPLMPGPTKLFSPDRLYNVEDKFTAWPRRVPPA